jgi:hypothetical protein
VAAELVESKGTLVVVTDVPPVFAVDLFKVLIIQVTGEPDVVRPDTTTFLTLMVFEPLPFISKMSVAFAAIAKLSVAAAYFNDSKGIGLTFNPYAVKEASEFVTAESFVPFVIWNFAVLSLKAEIKEVILCAIL